MARVNTVRSYRGKRTCQHGDYPRCGGTRDDHDRNGTITDHAYDPGYLTCQRCGTEIHPGKGYKYVKTRAHRGATGRKQVRCLNCPSWRASELTSSPHRSATLAAQEAAEVATGGMSPTFDPDERDTWPDRFEDHLDELRAVAADVATEYEYVAEGLRESAANIEDGFGHPTYQSEELEMRAEAMDDAARNVEQWDYQPGIGGDDDDPDEWEVAADEATQSLMDTIYEAEEG